MWTDPQFIKSLFKFSKNIRNVKLLFLTVNDLKRQSHKMAKHTQTIRRQIAGELFECVWPLC